MNAVYVKTSENGNAFTCLNKVVRPRWMAWATDGNNCDETANILGIKHLIQPHTHDIVYHRIGFFILENMKFEVHQYTVLGHHIRNPHDVLSGYDVLTVEDSYVFTWYSRLDTRETHGVIGDFFSAFKSLCEQSKLPFASHYSRTKFINELMFLSEAGFTDILHEDLGFIQIDYAYAKKSLREVVFKITCIYGHANIRVSSELVGLKDY